MNHPKYGPTDWLSHLPASLLTGHGAATSTHQNRVRAVVRAHLDGDEAATFALVDALHKGIGEAPRYYRRWLQECHDASTNDGYRRDLRQRIAEVRAL